MQRPKRPNSYPAVIKLVNVNNNRIPDEFSGEGDHKSQRSVAKDMASSSMLNNKNFWIKGNCCKNIIPNSEFKIDKGLLMMRVIKILLNELYVISSRPIVLAFLLTLMNLAGYHNKTVIMFLETVMFIQLAFDNFEKAREISVNSSLVRLFFDMSLYFGTSVLGHSIIQHFKITESEFKFVNTGQIWNGVTDLFYSVAGKPVPESQGWLDAYFDMFHVHRKPKQTDPWLFGLVTAGIPYLHMINVITVFRIATLTIDLVCRSGEAYFASLPASKVKATSQNQTDIRRRSIVLPTLSASPSLT